MLRVVPGSIPGETPSFACDRIIFVARIGISLMWKKVEIFFLQVKEFLWGKLAAVVLPGSSVRCVHVVCFGQ